jgi:D-serine deaminase-like pyridoxal phosphate-dependent protein
MARWCAAQGLALAPHGKTTMSPALWKRQIDHGAWGITVANEHQLAVALGTGCPRIQVANNLVRPAAAFRLRQALGVGACEQVIVWIDSDVALDRLCAAPPTGTGLGANSQIDVLVEIGADGGRTGVRHLDEAVRLAAMAARRPQVHLLGVAGYEGAVADPGAQPDRYGRYVRSLSAAAQAIAEIADLTAPLVSIGGSADLAQLVALVKECISGTSARLMVRPGVYVAHDDGMYQARAETDLDLTAALSVWTRVLSLPEPGLALLDAGLRDLGCDHGLPTVLGFHRGVAALGNGPSRLLRLDDQHAYLECGKAGLELAVGDLVELGLSHPCTTFDKWPVIAEVEDRHASGAPVLGALRTYF